MKSPLFTHSQPQQKSLALMGCLVWLFCLTGGTCLSSPIKVNEAGTHLIKEDNRAFVWVGDTAWELFHRLSREEAVEYLQNRAEKGFSVIQAVVLAELDGVRTPNYYGDLPLIDGDPGKPNEAYFEHVDFIVEKVEALGLVIGMLPTWGDKLESVNPGAGPVIFNAENAHEFGAFLGERYGEKAVVWILGGDRNVLNLDVYHTWNAMANGIEKGSVRDPLITYHPRGTAISAWWFHSAEWLDFNMYQSGHERFNNVYDYAESCRNFAPRKPFVDGEPAYEDIAIRFWEYMDFSKPYSERVPSNVLDDDGIIADLSHFKDGFIKPYDVRLHAYWNFLSGAVGYTYGNNAIWQMFRKGDANAIPALTDWRDAMDRPGAHDMRHVRDLFESHPFHLLQPDQSLIWGQNRKGPQYIAAASATDGSYAYIYLPRGELFTLNLEKWSSALTGLQAQWMDPRTGRFQPVELNETQVLQVLSPPTSGEGQDWLLVLDSESGR